jgi:hypothetical protein
MPERPPSIGQSGTAPAGAGKSGRVGAATGPEPVGKARPLHGVAPAEAAEQVNRTEGVAGTTAVQAPAAVPSVTAVSPLTPASAADRVQSIADRLRRGALTPSQAVEELIADTVQSNLPGLPSDSPLSRELRALLSAYAADDPYLASRISRLGIHR